MKTNWNKMLKIIVVISFFVGLYLLIGLNSGFIKATAILAAPVVIILPVTVGRKFNSWLEDNKT